MTINTNRDQQLKEFYEKGFQVFSGILNKEQIENIKSKISKIKKKQDEHFTEEELLLIGEQNTIRSPFLYEECFKHVFYNDFCRTLVKKILGDFAILSLQNCIFIPGNQSHHQSFYHRDLIYQKFTSSVPISINLYCCLTDYREDNGGTSFLIGSHKKDTFSNTSKVETPTVLAGSYILFNSMTFHKAGVNTTNQPRIGINNMYTLPFVKQQINYANLLKDKTTDESLNQLLGFKSREFSSVEEFRNYRLQRVKNEK